LRFVTIKTRATLRPIKGTDHTDASQAIFDVAAIVGKCNNYLKPEAYRSYKTSLLVSVTSTSW